MHLHKADGEQILRTRRGAGKRKTMKMDAAGAVLLKRQHMENRKDEKLWDKHE